MSNEIKNKLRRAFGIDKLEYALFYNWQYSLRFELNTSGSYVEMFTSAYNRARKLLEHTFKNSNELYVLVRFYNYSPDDNKQYKEMRRLKRCGFELPKQYLVDKSSYICFAGEEDEHEEWHHEYLLLIEINNCNYLAILWAICSQDLGIQPSAKVEGYFIDFQRQIIAHPYDDRGMDIVATKKEAIEFLYRDYYHWLLDYDLELMQRTFLRDV